MMNCEGLVTDVCGYLYNFQTEEVGGDYPLLIIVFSHRAFSLGNMCEKYDILKATNCCITGQFSAHP